MRYTVMVASALLAATAAFAGESTAEKVPLYTNDDLDRMFGPPPPPVGDAVDKSGPEDWRWVEGFLERQYARIDADRQHDLNRRLVEVTEEYPPYSGPCGGYIGGHYIGYRGPGFRPPHAQHPSDPGWRYANFGGNRGILDQPPISRGTSGIPPAARPRG